MTQSLRRFFRIPPHPRHYRLDQVVTLDMELSFYREACTCSAGKDARLVAGALDGMP